MKRILILLSLGLASTLLLAACGGDDDSDGNGPGNTPPAGQTTTGNTPTNGGGATNTPSNNGGGNGDDASELEDALTRWMDSTFKATFKTISTSEGVEQEGTVTIAQSRPRYAMKMEMPEGSLGLYENEEGTFSCFGAEEFGQCTRGALGGESLFDLRDLAEDDDTTTYRRIDDRNIGGRDSRCWEGTDSETGGTVVTCISKAEGFLTYMKGGEFEMTLETFSTSVSDEDFELPYPVM